MGHLSGCKAANLRARTLHYRFTLIMLLIAGVLVLWANKNAHGSPY